MKKPSATHNLQASGLGKLFIDHGMLIGFVLAMSMLIYCVYSIQQIFELPTDEKYRTEQMKKNSIKSFDKQTIEAVKELRTSSEGPVTLPDDKINPFIE